MLFDDDQLSIFGDEVEVEARSRHVHEERFLHPQKDTPHPHIYTPPICRTRNTLTKNSSKTAYFNIPQDLRSIPASFMTLPESPAVQKNVHVDTCICMCISIYICIYIYISLSLSPSLSLLLERWGGLINPGACRLRT